MQTTAIPITVDRSAASIAGNTCASPEVRNHCVGCSLHNLCLPTGLKESDMLRLDKIIVRRRRVARDTLLYRAGEPFRNLYAIKVGHFKTQRVDRSGGQQITGFQ